MSNPKTKRSTLYAKRCYLDYASTTPLDPRVKKVMEPFFTKTFGNPSSIHAEGAAAKKALLGARTTVARALEAHPDEIVFTSGGTEANNAAIFGAIATFTRSDLVSGKRLDLVRPHVITTNIEHASVLEPIRELERQGKVEVTYVPAEPNGIVKPENILAAIRPNTVLVSVMYANNEIGTIQPIRGIGKMIHDLRLRNNELRHRSLNAKPARLNSRSGGRSTLNAVKNRLPIFHTDACQAPLYLHCLVNALGVDLMTLDGHKLYGPKGVGALYVRRNTPLAPVMLGGGQERRLRSTTENIPAVVGFAEALRIATSEREKESERIAALRDLLYASILQNTSIGIVTNGSMKEEERLPNNLNISLLGVDTEFLTLQLDAAGIAVSTKSSCLKDEKESYVIRVLGGDTRRAGSSLRFTLGRYTTKTDITYAARVFSRLIEKH